MRWFKKKTEQTIVEKPIEEKEERISYLEVARKLGKYSKNKIDSNKLFNKLFPRQAATYIATKGGKQVAMDEMHKPVAWDNALPEEMLPFFTEYFIGYQACALLAQNAYIKKICEIPAQDAAAVDYKLHYRNSDADKDEKTDEDEEQQMLSDIKLKSDKDMQIKDVCKNATICKKTYGQCIVIPTFNVDVDMSKPFNPSAVKKGTYTGMQIIEPFWVTYDLTLDQVSRPDKKGFYEPEYYHVNGGKKIHKSWIRKLTNGKVSDILKPTYYYGGIPLPQQVYSRVFCAEKVANEAPKLALSKRLLVVDGNVNNLIANPEIASETLSGLSSIRDNFGFFLKNPGDQVMQIDTSLADFDALIMTQFQLVAAIGEMPVTKLMKTQLKGLANTGDYEQKDYAQSLIAIQENDFNYILDFHYELLSLSEYGKDLELNVIWNPIDTPTELEMAQIENQQAQTDATYVSAGVLSQEEVHDMLRQNEDSRFRNLSEETPQTESFLDENGEIKDDAAE
ncbi:MAG: DUF1073 domain-containing protein [Bacteroidales bacterium]|nr:DUF1073 domain-containing protein [Bacteroidales bacterium]